MAKLDEYLTRTPSADDVPAGRVVVHNQVNPARRLGTRGFRAWLTAPDAQKLEPCGCGWAPEIGEHYRVRAAEARWGRIQAERV